MNCYAPHHIEHEQVQLFFPFTFFFFSHSLGLNTALTLAILISLVMNAREKKKAEETDCWRESLARYTGVVGQGEINK